MASWIRLLLVFVCLGALPAWAAPPEPDCSNPRSAAHSMFNWLKPGSYNPAKAKACMDVPPGTSGERIAVQLKQVLDARGLYVPVHTMSVDRSQRPLVGLDIRSPSTLSSVGPQNGPRSGSAC